MAGTALLTSAHAAPASAAPQLAPVMLAEGLSISVPSGPVALGSGAPGSTFSRQLGTVTVTASSSIRSWTASVTLTSSFHVTQGDQSWPLPNDRVRYRSGPATSVLSGLLDLCSSKQLAAETLVQTRAVFGCSNPLILGSVAGSVSWNPTLTIQTEPTDPAGTYTGTITHSVL